ncbi:MAG TPA: dipeptidase [Saprospiraceae bacterium]|nr:dipeptidase [Saprospiraceae bacterium]
MNRMIIFTGICLTILSCSGSKKIASMETDPLLKKAHDLAQKFIIVDGHVDLPYRLKVQNFRLEREYTGIPIESETGDFDFKRSRAGGLDAPFMSIFIPASYQEDGRAKALADSLIDMVEYIANENDMYFEIAKAPEDIKRIKAQGKIALPMGMENGAPVEDDLALIPYFRERGISYITLTHSKDNKICDSSYDTTRTWGGLSPMGYEVIQKMQQSRIMIDISHVSDQTFYQVIDHVSVPVIASHSSARKFTPGFERNMDDDMIVALAKNGGVIMINFGSSFLDGEVQRYRDEKRAELMEILNEKNISWRSEEAKPVITAFQKENPNLYSDIEKVADHIDHVRNLVGINHIGLGSDFDGVGDSLPTGLKDVADYPNLIYVLLKRGYSEEDIEKICSGNIFRVWEQVLEHGRRSIKTRD